MCLPSLHDEIDKLLEGSTLVLAVEGPITCVCPLAAFIAVLGCFVALALFGNIALMAFGSAFASAHGVLMILASGQLVATYFGIGSIALNMTGHQRAAMNIMVVTSVLGIVAAVGNFLVERDANIVSSAQYSTQCVAQRATQGAVQHILEDAGPERAADSARDTADDTV